jgi:hypothetical protein
MQTSRLLTAGCSFTLYKWQTWADFLGKHYDVFVNKGIPGTDNPTIARIVTAMAEPGDTVVIMWTCYQRHNYKILADDTYNYSSSHLGVSSLLQDKYYFTNIFNQYERFLTTLDYVQWVMADSTIRNYTVYHFCAFPFLTGELHSPISTDMKVLINEKQFIIDNITQPSLSDFSQNDFKEPMDSHPVPDSQYNFYANIVCPKLGLTPLKNLT